MSPTILASIRKKERIDESYHFDTKTTFNLGLESYGNMLRAVVYNNEREKFVLQAEFEHEDMQHSLREVLEKTDIFQKDFQTVRYRVITPVFTLIPEELFEKGREEEYLSFSNNVAPDHFVFSNHLEVANAYMVFALRATEMSLMRSRFNTVQFIHSGSALIEAVMRISKNQQGVRMYIYTGPDYIEIVLADEGQLKFYNRFAYQNSEDFIYYPLFVCEQLGLNPEQLELFLMGDIGKSSPHYQMIYRYFRHVDFVPRLDGLSYSYRLEEHDAHRFFHLYSLELCGS